MEPYFPRDQKTKDNGNMYSSARGEDEDEDGQAVSGLVVKGNRASRLVVEDFVEIWALDVRKA